MNKLWFILTILLFLFALLISKRIKFENYNIIKMLKSLNKKSRSGLFLSLGTKIGVGSIIGTSMAIYVGGPGSILWILIFSFLTSSLIYYESFIGSTYKVKNESGYMGGPFFYIKGINKTVAYISLILLILCYSFFFQMIQTNTITEILLINYNINIYLIAVIFLIIILFIMFFSIKELLGSMNKIVPLMCILYIILGLIVIFTNINQIPNIITNIVSNAFTKRGVLVGAFIGIKRAIFLSEVMIGTSSTSSSIDDISPIEAGRTQTIGMYFITFVVCLITAFMVLSVKSTTIFSSYNELISNVFMHHFGNVGIILLTIIILMFALTTIISGFYIGESNISVITKNKKIIFIFKVFVLLFCMSGIFISSKVIWEFIDILMFILILINLIYLYKIFRGEKNDRKRLG